MSCGAETEKIFLKIAQIDEGLAILLRPEAEEILGAVAGQEVVLELSENGQLVLRKSLAGELRLGQEFMANYDRTFRLLGKS